MGIIVEVGRTPIWHHYSPSTPFEMKVFAVAALLLTSANARSLPSSKALGARSALKASDALDVRGKNLSAECQLFWLFFFFFSMWRFGNQGAD